MLFQRNLLYCWVIYSQLEFIASQLFRNASRKSDICIARNFRYYFWRNFFLSFFSLSVKVQSDVFVAAGLDSELTENNLNEIFDSLALPNFVLHRQLSHCHTNFVSYQILLLSVIHFFVVVYLCLLPALTSFVHSTHTKVIFIYTSSIYHCRCLNAKPHSTHICTRSAHIRSTTIIPDFIHTEWLLNHCH